MKYFPPTDSGWARRKKKEKQINVRGINWNLYFCSFWNKGKKSSSDTFGVDGVLAFHPLHLTCNRGFLLYLWLHDAHICSAKVEMDASSRGSFLCNFHVIIFHPRSLVTPPSPPKKRKKVIFVHVCIYYRRKVVYCSNKNPPSLCLTFLFWRRGYEHYFSLSLQSNQGERKWEGKYEIVCFLRFWGWCEMMT